jgi:hypothetical protein
MNYLQEYKTPAICCLCIQTITTAVKECTMEICMILIIKNGAFECWWKGSNNGPVRKIMLKPPDTE